MKEDNPWESNTIAIKALTNPNDNEVLNLTELNAGEISLLANLLTLSKALDSELLRDMAINYARLKRSKERKGERALINALGRGMSRLMQNIQMQRYKTIRSNIDEGYEE
ncbi:MAG: hypothetical protein KatS3mg003_1438 [Candidatus Nitrosocaldaceae archaeon]|nr:MAG: hypothetical protein KatS3mg003_1438 [Candidatus Nitrosocaldaceae archaeon]